MFFKDFFKKTKEVFYQVHQTKKEKVKKCFGFRLIACDGTGFRVPDKEENQEKFGVHKNQHKEVASCRIVAFHDVLNRLFIELLFHKRAQSELTVVHQNFDKIPADAIIVYDRGFDDTLLLARHLKAEKHCVMRMKLNSNVVKKFIQSKQKEEIVSFCIGERSYKSAVNKYGLKNNFPKFSTFDIRLIRIELDNGEIEILATTLLDMKRYPHAQFKGLYAKRWGVETAFDEIKNQLKLGLFSGYSYQKVMQDIWSVFIFYNFRSILLFQVEKDIKKQKNPTENKCQDIQVNRNVAISIIQSHFFELFQLKTLHKALKWVFNLLAKNTQRVRKRISTERKKKMMRSNDRHQTEKNYKPAF